jgi:autotransporter-associated beta strand protein
VLVHDGNNSSAISMGVLVRDGGVLTLGDATAGPVRFVSSIGQSGSASSSPTTVSDAAASPKRSLVKFGTGLLVPKDVAYTDVAETADKSANFDWRIGRAVSNQGSQSYDDGAVRSVYSGTTANSIEPFPVRLVGGVWEIDALAQAGEITLSRPLGQNAGQVTWSRDTNTGSDYSGGGGFAAYGQPVIVDLDAAGASALTWNTTANFIQNYDPLILGSRSANRRVTLIDNINLDGATREIRVVDNPDSDDDRAAIGGVLSGTGSSALTKTGDGVLELLAGLTHTYAGTTTVSAGTLLVNGALNAQTTAVTVDGGVLGGTGSIARPVTVNAGGMIVATSASSTTGLQVTGNLTVSGKVGVRVPVLAYGTYVVATVSGTLNAEAATPEDLPKGYKGKFVVDGGKLLFRVSVDATGTAILIR